MPYSCARAICLSFCYDIRWALTPIFGESFIKECLRPEHAGFRSFKINSEVVRCAQLEAEGLRSGASSRSGSPVDGHDNHAVRSQEIPRSEPAPAQLKQLRPRKELPAFNLRSPFESDSEASDRKYTRDNTAFESPELSPKTTRHNHSSPGWTSINRQHNDMAPPSPPNNTPVGSLSHSLLTEPRTLPMTSWRALEPKAAVSKATKTHTDIHDKYRPHKRRNPDSPHDDADRIRSASHSSSESDDVDIDISPSATKRQRREDTPAPASSAASTPVRVKTGRSKKYTATDARAAQWLLNLSVRDSQLSMGPEEMRGQKRRASLV